jgi:hypothetical protein
MFDFLWSLKILHIRRSDRGDNKIEIEGHVGNIT